ncbi:MAG: endonuclease/exonuclease/phosphatase family protein [Patescibacteria group bacterium]|jgi:endonuclease/exonuclease/phosphatase family metal-dependent hydrolase
MRIITLNCWCGRAVDRLIPFFEHYRTRTDVFFLQEILNGDQREIDRRHPGAGSYADLFNLIAAALPGFQGFFAGFEDPDRMSNAVFARDSLSIHDISEHVVYEPKNPVHEGHVITSSRKLQTITLDVNGHSVLYGNLHGLWVNGPKTDTPDRLKQSEKVVEVFKGHAGPKTLVGDFNLLPDTESVRMLETHAGLRNLVVEHAIPSTRTPLYRHYDNPSEPNFADYVMPSHDQRVKGFKVLPDVVSDHAALYAEFA